jgi:NADPH:quinone reductase
VRAVRQGGSRVDDIVVEEIPQPLPGDDEALVRVEAAAINPFDLGVVLGHDSPASLDYVPGRDLAGVVESGPTELVESQVWATGGDIGTRRDGFHAEYVVLPVDGIRPRPAGLSADEAASVGGAFTTAWWGLVEAAGLQPLDRVLVTGGAGAVGSAAVQIARCRGSTQIVALVVSEDELRRARRFGASLATKDLEETVTGSDGQRATICLDTVGGAVLDTAVAAMERHSRLIVITTPGDGTISFNLRHFYRASLTLHGLFTLDYDVIDGARVLEALADGFSSGALQPPRIAETFPLSRADEAYALANSRPPGKVVLIP